MDARGGPQVAPAARALLWPLGDLCADAMRAALTPPASKTCFSTRSTKASAVSATSRHPLSIVSACPRPSTETISVIPGLSFCCL